LEIPQELFFELLPGVYAFWWEFSIPVCYNVLKGDDEGFSESSFVAAR
jgi:hypothetical protein